MNECEWWIKVRNVKLCAHVSCDRVCLVNRVPRDRWGFEKKCFPYLNVWKIKSCDCPPPPPPHHHSKEFGVILDITVPLETLGTLETQDHQDCLVQGGSMESVEFLECRAFRVHQWVFWLDLEVVWWWWLIFLFSAGTWRIWPAYRWSGSEDVAGWVSGPK